MLMHCIPALTTTLFFVDPESRAHIVDAIRPILPSIRQTPPMAASLPVK
jgi:hypothetical protein